jgi:hypothetical protein
MLHITIASIFQCNINEQILYLTCRLCNSINLQVQGFKVSLLKVVQTPQQTRSMSKSLTRHPPPTHALQTAQTSFLVQFSHRTILELSAPHCIGIFVPAADMQPSLSYQTYSMARIPPSTTRISTCRQHRLQVLERGRSISLLVY